MLNVQAGLMWTGEDWVLVVTRQFGDLLTMSHSPAINDVEVRALRGAAQVGLPQLREALGEEVRLWLMACTEEEQERVRGALYSAPI